MRDRGLVVTSDEEGLGSLTQDVDDPNEYFSSEEMFILPEHLLRELHGWPQETWPEGWRPR